MSKRTTIADIARLAGVARSTVSGVLGARPDSIRVRDETRQRILKVAEDLDYVPENAARALSTGKTYHIGYLVSSSATLGLANSYFSTVLAGVQRACQEQGYNCTVSTYDLSNLEGFVMPSKLRRRCVDGVVIAGAVSSGVIELFMDKDIPFVLSGDNTDFPLQGILSVASDMAENWFKIFEHLTQLGHQRIAAPSLRTAHALQNAEKGLTRLRLSYPNSPVDLVCDHMVDQGLDLGEVNEFQAGQEAGREWLRQEPSIRPTAVVSNDQWCVGFLRSVLRGGARCPDDVSVVCVTDTTLTEMYNPAVTSLSLNLFENGRISAEVLLGLLDKSITRAEAIRRVLACRKSADLIVRESTGPASI